MGALHYLKLLISQQPKMIWHTEVNVSKQQLKVNQRCSLNWTVASRKKWKLLPLALPFAKVLLTFMIFFSLPLLLSVFVPEGQWKNTADSRLLSEFPFADDGLPCQFKRHRINLFQWFLFRLNASLFFSPPFFSISLLAPQNNNK